MTPCIPSFVRRFALILPLGIGACHSPVGTDPACQLPLPGEEVGSWRVLSYPEGILSAWGVSDGANFLAVSGKKCWTCEIQLLNEEADSWSSIAAEGVLTPNNVGRQAATERYIASAEVTSRTVDGLTNPWQVAVFDRANSTWTYTDFPPESAPRGRTSIHIVDGEVLVWGGYTPTYPDLPGSLPGTPLFGGYVFDPETQVFESIAPAWEEGASTQSVNGQTASVATPGGLFAWGVSPDQLVTRGGLYSLEAKTWSYSGESSAPPRRRDFQMTYRDGFIYLWGGHLPEVNGMTALGDPVGSAGQSDFTEYYRDLWRLSLEKLTWEALPVPAHADLQGAKGAWSDDTLVFVGYRCGPPDLLDIRTMEWKQGSFDGRARDPGWLFSASNKIISNYVHPTFGLVADAVWVFEMP